MVVLIAAITAAARRRVSGPGQECQGVGTGLGVRLEVVTLPHRAHRRQTAGLFDGPEWNANGRGLCRSIDYQIAAGGEAFMRVQKPDF